MMQEIVFERPPMYADIIKAFPAVKTTYGVVYSFGDKIYNPDRQIIPPSIQEHEGIHGSRQGEGDSVLEWWEQYIKDPVFRLVEEVHAHRAEYQWFLTQGNRKQRRRALRAVSRRLASPIYGRYLITAQRARKLIDGSE